jgi:tripartite-type tricarboxylate transporter receptor subunit TctC
MARSVAAVAAATTFRSKPSLADDYPRKPITIYIPFAPGGGTDAVARNLGPALSRAIGESIVLENVSGGAGNIASARVSRAAPDGYTLIMHNVAFALNAAIYRKLQFNPVKDFVPIAFINSTPLVHVGRTSIPANSMPELLAWMKKNHTRYATPGVGSTGHMGAMLLAKVGGVEIDYIPYRGGGPALQDVIGGHVDMTNVTLQNAIEPIKSGLVKGFAISSATRSKAIPNVPSIVQELGPGAGILFWNALLAPAGTPQPVIDKINTALEQAYTDKELLTNWQEAGLDLYPKEQRTPAAAKTLLADEMTRWAKFVQENHLEAQQ